MAKQSGRQKEIVGRVMHEFKHGELESAGRKVRNPRQAIAIGLSEAGSSNRKSASENRKSRARTETKERKGETAQQRKEGRSKVASGARAGSGTAAQGKQKASGDGAGSGKRARSRAARGEPTRAQLYAEAQRRGLHGCSRLSKADLEQALRQS